MKVKKKKKWEHESELKDEKPPFFSQETRNSIIAAILFMFALLSALALIDQAGVAGAYANSGFSYLFGRMGFFLPLLLLFTSLSFVFEIHNPHWKITALGGVSLLASVLGAVDLFSETSMRAGVLGHAFALPILLYFSRGAGVVIFATLFLVGLMVTFNVSLFALLRIKPQKEKKEEKDVTQKENGQESELSEQVWEPVALEKTKAMAKKLSSDGQKEPLQETLSQEEVDQDYIPPPLELLEPDGSAPSSGDIQANKNIIQRTLEEFGIEVEMDAVSVGPAVTQYTLKPAQGVNISRITGLTRNLSLALAAHPLRIEAPIPGKSLVGIEIPNKQASTVRLRSLLKTLLGKRLPSSLMLALGRDVAGEAFFAQLDAMPHLLVAGATGSGKSAMLNGIITTLLYLNSPKQLRFILIDPKRVEFALYEGIPHLLAPVIVDTKKAVNVLKWALNEMEQRYQMLESAGVRDIKSYNEKAKKDNSIRPLPYLVLIIDEMADLMAKFKREVEGSIVRLAQMARAVGIHLIASTQRPSTDVVTGLIKANITARIAMRVASQIDSRTILDQGGAEKLLGYGDMLFMTGQAVGMKRLQGPFLNDKEVKKVVAYLRDLSWEDTYEGVQYESEEMNVFLGSGGASGEGDDLYEDAKQIVSEAGKASASLLQRKLQIGYARAARLLDLMEEEGVIGPTQGAKPREVIKG